MFGFSKGAAKEKKLHAQYERKLAEAMQAQRRGDLNRFASLTAEADRLEREIEAIENAS